MISIEGYVDEIRGGYPAKMGDADRRKGFSYILQVTLWMDTEREWKFIPL